MSTNFVIFWFSESPKKRKNNQSQISPHFGGDPYFAPVKIRVKGKKAFEQKNIENSFIQVKHGKKILVAEFLNKYSIDEIIMKEPFEGKGPFYVFSNAALENLQTLRKNIENGLEDIAIHFKQLNFMDTVFIE